MGRRDEEGRGRVVSGHRYQDQGIAWRDPARPSHSMGRRERDGSVSGPWPRLDPAHPSCLMGRREREGGGIGT